MVSLKIGYLASSVADFPEALALDILVRGRRGMTWEVVQAQACVQNSHLDLGLTLTRTDILTGTVSFSWCMGNTTFLSHSFNGRDPVAR